MHSALDTVVSALVVVAANDPVPEDEDVVAGWTAFGLFILGLVAIGVIGYFLVRSLKNVARAADEGRYAPSDPRPTRPGRPARGLAAARQQREAAAQAGADGAADGEQTPPDVR